MNGSRIDESPQAHVNRIWNENKADDKNTQNRNTKGYSNALKM
jgi:hypothetical protein